MSAALRRFGRHFVVLTDGCWLWTAHLGRGGYPHFSIDRGTARAHRWLWQQISGALDRDVDLDHLCRNRWCVNPAHLEPVTRGENLRRAYAANPRRDHCAQGHPFDDANTFQRSDGGRGCRTCRNNASRASKARARAALAATQPSQTEHDLATTERNAS